MSVTRGDTEMKQFLMTSISRMNSLNWRTILIEECWGNLNK